MKGRLTFTEDEQPIVAHIWGDKPENFRQMSIGMAELGFRGLILIWAVLSQMSRKTGRVVD